VSAQPPKAPRTASLGERTSNFLLYGFLISIVLHLIIGPFIKMERTPEAPEKVETVKIDKMPTPTPKPTPTPTPTPPPKTPPPQTPQPPQPQQIKINTINQTSKTVGGTTEQGNTHVEGSTQGVPQGVPSGVPTTVPTIAPTVAPTPVPTPTPLACANPNVPPRTLQAYLPETPAIAQQQGISGVVEVIVSLDEASHQVVPPAVRKTANAILNPAAINAAAKSRFQTEIKNCKPQASKYVFVVEFQSQ
jgi:hypothetical protein